MSKNEQEVPKTKEEEIPETVETEVVEEPSKAIVERKMPSAVVTADESLQLAEVAEKLFASHLYPNAKNAAGAFAIVLYGRELGIGAMTALQNISIIKGKPSCDAQLLLARALQMGVKIEVLLESDEGCQVRFTRPNFPPYVTTFDVNDAKKAGLIRADSGYTKYPRDMYYWRTITRGLRRIAPEVMLGMYTIEEMTNGEYNTVDEIPVNYKAKKKPGEYKAKKEPKGEKKDPIKNATIPTDKQKTAFNALTHTKIIPPDVVEKLELFKNNKNLQNKDAYSQWIDYLIKLPELENKTKPAEDKPEPSETEVRTNYTQDELMLKNKDVLSRILGDMPNTGKMLEAVQELRKKGVVKNKASDLNKAEIANIILLLQNGEI